MPDPTPDGTPTPVCPPTKWARGLTAAHAATDDASRAEPRRTLPIREGITFARGSIADARRALAAARPAPEHVQAAARAADAAIAAAGGPDVVLAHVCPPGRHRPDDDPTPGDRCKDCGRELTWRGPGPHDWDAADPATGESVARDPAATMRAAADRMRDPYLCNFELGLAHRLADWLDSAAIDAEEIGPDFRAERVACRIIGQPDPHPGAPSPARSAAAASLARELLGVATRPAAAGEGMYRDVYFQIQALLDEALGTEADCGAGEGIVADVRLALTRARQRGAVKAVRRKAADYASGAHPAGEHPSFDVAGDLDGYADAIESGRLAL